MQYTYLVLVHLDVSSSLLARLAVVTYQRLIQKCEERSASLLTSPIIRVVRVRVGGPLPLGRLTCGGGISRSWLSAVAQTSGSSVSLGHNGGSTSVTGPASALETGISAEAVLAVGIWLRHPIHRLDHAIR